MKSDLMFIKLLKKLAGSDKQNHHKKGDKSNQLNTNTANIILHTKPDLNENFENKQEKLTFPLFDRIYKFYRKNRNLVYFIIGLGLISIVLFKQIIVVSILILLLIVSALSKLIQEPIPFVVGLDLCLFTTVVVGHEHGAFIGFIIGGTASFLGSLLRTHQEGDTIVVPILGYFWVSVAIAFMPSTISLMEIGIISTLIYSFHNAIVFGYLRHFSIHTFTFLATAIPFNLFLINQFGEKLAQLI